ncbi:ABC transporter ATP-binding protein [Devosia sp.]|uniref:ABC transporter ATP-binding protein n=1 Tax=Devosia sp. TaxID=1871048 RepID=UPI003BA99A98
MARGADLKIDIALKRFGPDSPPLFENFGLAITPGSIVALTGPSGVGKSTLLRLIGGIDRDFTGTITIDGRPASEALPPGFVFQDPRLLPWLTALDNIRAMREGTTREAALSQLKTVGLEGAEALYPHQLSGGMQRRVALARALSVNRGLLLLDEPFVSLDQSLVAEMEALLREVLAQTGATALIVTHDQAQAERLAQRVITLTGRPVQASEGAGRPAP